MPCLSLLTPTPFAFNFSFCSYGITSTLVVASSVMFVGSSRLFLTENMKMRRIYEIILLSYMLS